MIEKGCKVVENQVAEAPPPPPPPPAIPKAPAAPAPPPPPPPAAPAPPKPPKVNKPITDPKLLKLGGKNVQPNRAELFNAIKTGGFKLKKVEIVDKSAPILTEDQETTQISTSGYVSVAAPPPPPGPPPPLPPIPTGPREKKPITNPALLKLGGKGAKPNIEELFNTIKSGAIRLRKVETKDKSGLILDEEQIAKKQQAENQEEKKEEDKIEEENEESEDKEESEESSEESEKSESDDEDDEEEEIDVEEVEEDADEITVTRCFKLK
uniref:WH2 domain-containing protein n=1 Tax=Acrobeloides nanus TaxID=290746 RepID=A0A914D652_9BILA